MQLSLSTYRTAKDTGEKISRAGGSTPSQSSDNLTLDLDPGVRFQTIRGFGGAFTESAGWALSKLGTEERKEVIDRCFNPVTGSGYTLCRSHINSCDFSLGNYSACESPDDTELAGFTLEREEKWLLPFIRDALAIPGARFELLLTPWSPPAWMKTNAAMNGGGSLRPECRGVWALFIVKFITAYRALGIPVAMVSVQNEPEAVQTWDSCIWTAEEEGEFVARFLGPELERAGLGDVDILIWDHNRDAMVRRAEGAIRFPGASRYIHGTAYHWYNGEQFDNAAAVHDLFPDKHLYFTEASIEKPPTAGGEWARAERYVHHIINDMNAWCEGWIDWNMVLTTEGGPNHARNFCDAPILVDVPAQRVIYQSAFWCLGQFSRFVRPGDYKIGCNVCGNIPAAKEGYAAGPARQQAGGPGIEATAFSRTGREAIVIVLNRTDDRRRLTIRAFGAQAEADLPPRSVTTFLVEKQGGTADPL